LRLNPVDIILYFSEGEKMARVMARNTARELTSNEIEHVSGGDASYTTIVSYQQYDEQMRTWTIVYDAVPYDTRV
jgi:hypothetical protein